MVGRKKKKFRKGENGNKTATKQNGHKNKKQKKKFLQKRLQMKFTLLVRSL